jgi:arsenate reductase-like glutaredoxin family protein
LEGRATVRETVNASKQRFGADDLGGVLEGASELIVAKGKKVVRVMLAKDELSVEELAKLMLGPTGNLRAPTARVGKKLLIGFNEEAYSGVFG